MSDRHGGDASAGAVAAPVPFVPGLPASTLRRWLVPVYVITIALFTAASAAQATLGHVLGELVWIAVALAVVRGSWLARGCSEATVERRFWMFMIVATVSLAVGEVLWVFEAMRSAPARPPVYSLSTLFDVLTIIVLAGLLMSLARFRQATWAARARFIVDMAAACVVLVGILDDWLVGPAFTGDGGAFAGLIYSFYPVVGALVLVGTLRVIIGIRLDLWQSWERRIGAAAGAFAVALILTPLGYANSIERFTAGWSPIVVDGILLTALSLAFAAAVHRLADRERPWRLRPVATLEPSYGWIASVVLPSIELLAIPAFGIAAFAAVDPTERTMRLVIVGVVSLLLAARTLLAVADSEALLLRADADPLTGLLNHRLFYDRLAGEIERSHRHGGSVGLVAIDIDDFGAVNSVGGHQAGDRALVEIAAAIGSAVRSQDLVCRVGGDEMTIILPGADLGAAFVTARRVLDGIRTVSDNAGRALSASAGVTAYPEHASDCHGLVTAADAALYWAKRHGKDRASLYEERLAAPTDPERTVRELRDRANLEAVRALAAAVDARDRGTQDHSRNVSALATALARELGLDEATVTLMGFAGLLHDIGKVGVPDSVLYKRSALTDQERSRLREHAPLGARILSSTAMSEILPWVRHHHERWDGSGYPDALAGEEIPLGARIIAVCEAYDSLVSGRFGRTPLTRRAALQQIDLDLGAKFDPVVGELFIGKMTPPPMSFGREKVTL